MEQRPTRHAGSGGVGAVMGAKGVKVIVVDDSGMGMRGPKDAKKFQEANKRWVEGLRKHPVTGEGLPAYGTNVLTNVINEAGAYPTKNFMLGSFRNLPENQRRDTGANRKSRGRPGHPWMPPGLRDSVFGDLRRQGRALCDQTAGI